MSLKWEDDILDWLICLDEQVKSEYPNMKGDLPYAIGIFGCLERPDTPATDGNPQSSVDGEGEVRQVNEDEIPDAIRMKMSDVLDEMTISYTMYYQEAGIWHKLAMEKELPTRRVPKNVLELARQHSGSQVDITDTVRKEMALRQQADIWSRRNW